MQGVGKPSTEYAPEQMEKKIARGQRSTAAKPQPRREQKRTAVTRGRSMRKSKSAMTNDVR